MISNHRGIILNPVASELLILPKSGDGSAVSLQLMAEQETALPSPLYHSGEAGIDIIRCSRKRYNKARPLAKRRSPFSIQPLAIGPHDR